MSKITKLGLAIVMMAMLFASCVPQKKMLYLKEAQMLSENQSINYVNERSINYKLQPGDNLYIRFVNIVDELLRERFLLMHLYTSSLIL